MAVQHVYKIDNEEEKKVLKAKAVRVKQFDKGLQTLVQDMIDTMREHNGVGLAAPQIGVLRRVVVVEQPAIEEEQEDGTLLEVEPAKLFVMVNPEIIEASTERFTMLEGCLSLPGWYGDIPRPDWVTIKYQDVHGKEHRLKKVDAKGYRVGRIAQHEIDHIDGVLFTERIEDLSTLRDMSENKPKRRGLLRRRRPNPDPVVE
ncbi:MAG: peptide deformylase [Chloroflexota bacterium]|nr:peptide deformylase [Chloroflexota bacterium]PLS82800.1 MAG: peptide deformylase [Chloroflexota bacterium]